MKTDYNDLEYWRDENNKINFVKNEAYKKILEFEKHQKEIDPLRDIVSAVSYHISHGVDIRKIQIKKSKYDFLLQETNCKNEEELRKLYYERFGKELYKIELLEG